MTGAVGVTLAVKTDASARRSFRVAYVAAEQRAFINEGVEVMAVGGTELSMFQGDDRRALESASELLRSQ